jgi:CheY-like chemotaxis protein
MSVRLSWAWVTNNKNKNIMPSKRALIVDDSRTAQFKLSKTLASYDLAIDTSSSAEGALSYLSYQLPDVIFMDHSMKGMNGLDAVRIIKSNSATATIPVVMYTAQSGELYLSQARAMGAIGVLSKDVMTDSDIQRVMSSLKIEPRPAPQSDECKTRRKAKPSDPKALNPAGVDLIQIRNQIAKSLDIQQSQFRRELQDNTRLLVNRFMSEIRGLREDLERQKKLDRDLFSESLAAVPINEGPGSRSAWTGAMVLLLGVLMWIGWQYRALNEEKERLLVSNQSLGEFVNKQQGLMKSQESRMDRIQNSKNSEQSEKLLQMLTWAINQSGEFPYNQTALGDDQLDVLSGLMEHLSDIDFIGTLTLDIHNGDFCLVMTENGSLSLPEQTTAVTDCNFISNTAFNFDRASQTTVEFENRLQSFPIVESGKLKVVVNAHGLSMPINRYPTMSENTYSDQWNAIAQKNNRLDMALSR